MIGINHIEINCLTAILVFVIIWIFRKQHGKDRILSLIVLGLLLDLNRVQGYFLMINKKTISYENAYVFFITGYYLFLLIKEKKKFTAKISKNKMIWGCILFVGAILGIVFEVVFPFQTPIINASSVQSWDGFSFSLTKEPLILNYFRVMLIFVRVVFYILIVFIFQMYVDAADYVKILKKVTLFQSVHVVYGLFEFVTKNIFNSGISSLINKLIFGLGKYTFAFDNIKNGLYSIQGFTTEPSHYSQVLFFSILLFFLTNYIVNKPNHRDWRIYLSLLLMLLSGSFASMMYIAILVLLQLLLVGKPSEISKKRVLSIIFAGLFIFICSWIVSRTNISNYFINRIRNVYNNMYLIISGDWQNKMVLSSETVRIMSMVETMKDVLKRPLFGLGCGVEWAHSGVISLLSYIGIVGAVSWFNMANPSLRWNKNDLTIIVLLIIVPNIFDGYAEGMLSTITVIVANYMNIYKFATLNLEES